MGVRVYGGVGGWGCGCMGVRMYGGRECRGLMIYWGKSMEGEGMEVNECGGGGWVLV